jgi:hypothetical protein
MSTVLELLNEFEDAIEWQGQGHAQGIFEQLRKEVERDDPALTERLRVVEGERDELRGYNEGFVTAIVDEQLLKNAAERRAESAEAELAACKDALVSIRDSTFRNSTTLRGMADLALSTTTERKYDSPEQAQLAKRVLKKHEVTLRNLSKET